MIRCKDIDNDFPTPNLKKFASKLLQNSFEVLPSEVDIFLSYNVIRAGSRLDFLSPQKLCQNCIEDGLSSQVLRFLRHENKTFVSLASLFFKPCIQTYALSQLLSRVATSHSRMCLQQYFPTTYITRDNKCKKYEGNAMHCENCKCKQDVATRH